MANSKLFHYVMYKHVLLKDARLGGLYYLLAVMILLYTIVEIFIQRGYLQVRGGGGGGDTLAVYSY